VSDPPRSPPSLLTTRLALEPLEPRHAGALWDVMADREIYRYQNGVPFASQEALRIRLERKWQGPADARERWWNWAIFLRPERDTRSLGTVEISLVDGGSRALLAYALGSDSWGRGYAFEAATAALAHVRVAMQLPSIDAYIDTRNARSIALAERLGFARLALLPENDVIDGKLADDYHYRLDLTKDPLWHA